MHIVMNNGRIQQGSTIVSGTVVDQSKKQAEAQEDEEVSDMRAYIRGRILLFSAAEYLWRIEGVPKLIWRQLISDVPDDTSNPMDT
jgi:hypothetical protein